jgi:L-threonylcarbamoyladenylate synthase
MEIAAAARRLAAGEVVAFPTETVYGLGADAANPAAVAKIFALKGRPSDHPLIMHVASVEHARRWASELPREALALMKAFWPGPLTLIVRKSAEVPMAVTGGQETVGLRCPSDPTAQQLLEEFARIGSGAIAAPSANRFGHVSPTTAAHVQDEFGDEVPVLDGGACSIGLESTIVDLSRGVAVLLRPGVITPADIERALGQALQAADKQAPRAPGMLASHYAPRTRLELATTVQLEAMRGRGDIAVLGLADAPIGSRVRMWIVGGRDAARYGHDFYANLRELDASGAKRLVVEAPPTDDAWAAVNDRLARAAAGAEPGDDP